jgi:hypothetical protein
MKDPTYLDLDHSDVVTRACKKARREATTYGEPEHVKLPPLYTATEVRNHFREMAFDIVEEWLTTQHTALTSVLAHRQDREAVPRPATLEEELVARAEAQHRQHRAALLASAPQLRIQVMRIVSAHDRAQQMVARAFKQAFLFENHCHRIQVPVLDVNELLAELGAEHPMAGVLSPTGDTQPGDDPLALPGDPR